MKSKLALRLFIVVAAMLLSQSARAQEDETYDFDGVADMDPQPDDPTDWMTSVNWSDGGADPNPLFGPPIPDFGTRVEIETSTYGVDAPEIGPGDVAQAFEVRIARFGGAGLLTMTGGTLETANSCTVSPFTCNRRLRVGAADVAIPEARNPGTFNLIAGDVTTDNLWIGSGSYGEMNMSGGTVTTRENLYFDWTFDAGSTLNITGGTINVGGVMRMYRTSVLNLDGGEILVTGPAELGTETQLSLPQTPDITATITGGLLASNNFLKIGGSVVVDGGILRAASFNESVSAGTIEVNEGGVLQFNNAQESIANVQSLIASGFITTSSPQGTAGFVIEVVDVNGTNFTQVAFAAGMPGDFNDDGAVDAADYVIWRKNDGSNSPLPNDGNLGIPIGSDHYTLWAANFGSMSGSSSGATFAAVPEPATIACGLWLLAWAVCPRRSARE